MNPIHTSQFSHITSLIWDLDRPDRSAIHFILSRHYRSITDLNWHNHNPDIVASTGIDSWIWMWDLRTSGRPVTGETPLCTTSYNQTRILKGLCAFNRELLFNANLTLMSIEACTIAGATQVKWNRHDENILASSHGNTLLIWDQRVRYLFISNQTA